MDFIEEYDIVTVPTEPAVTEPAADLAVDHRPDVALRALHIGYTVLPIVAGADKFVHALVDWDMYLSPLFARVYPGNPHTFMKAVGVIEVAAGLLTAVKPKYGGYVVAGWLGAITLNLVIQRRYWDIALRDVGLAVGAFALARLAEERSDRG